MGTDAAADDGEETLLQQSELQHTNAKQNGNDAETWVRDHYDLQPQDTDICPEYAHDAVDPRTGTPIEIKSCQIRYGDDSGRGRFQIWDYAHDTLLEHGGGYIFVVHEPRTEEFTVYFHRPLSAEAVDERIGNWHPIDHSLRPDQAHRTEVSQSTVFTDIGVDRIEAPDPEEQDENEFDADIIETDPQGEATAVATDGEGLSQVERVKQVKSIIRETEKQSDDDMAPHAAVIGRLQTIGLSPDQANHRIDQLKMRGEIYEPATDCYRTV